MSNAGRIRAPIQLVLTAPLPHKESEVKPGEEPTEAPKPEPVEPPVAPPVRKQVPFRPPE